MSLTQKQFIERVATGQPVTLIGTTPLGAHLRASNVTVAEWEHVPQHDTLDGLVGPRIEVLLDDWRLLVFRELDAYRPDEAPADEADEDDVPEADQPPPGMFPEALPTIVQHGLGAGAP